MGILSLPDAPTAWVDTTGPQLLEDYLWDVDEEAVQAASPSWIIEWGSGQGAPVVPGVTPTALPEVLTLYFKRPDFEYEDPIGVVGSTPVTVDVWFDTPDPGNNPPTYSFPVLASIGAEFSSVAINIPQGTTDFALAVYGFMGCSTETLFYRDTAFSEESACFDCSTINPNETLAELRVRMARRLGFSAQADNLPPGMPELLNEFLQSAQNFMYREYPALDTRYFFQWQCVQGQRFYGLTDTEGNQCDLRLDPYKNIEGAWLIDDGGTWFPLVNGIRPTFYTSLSQEGLPGFYEIRQCLEIFPAPSNSAYQVAIKGHFGLLPFAEDTDQSTINGELVYLWALANAALYYGRHDAEALSNQAQRYLSNLVAGTHGSRRYIPGGRLPPPAIMPRPVGGW